MPLESLKARIAMLLEEMVHQPEDTHEIQESLREKLSEMRTLGLEVPQDLVKLELQLSRDLKVGDDSCANSNQTDTVLADPGQ